MIRIVTILLSCLATTTCTLAQGLLAERLTLSGVPWNGTAGTAVISTHSPLTLATIDVIGQPMRFMTGPSGSIRALEIGSLGSTSISGPLAIGQSVGTYPQTVAYLSSVPHDGVGLLVDLRGSELRTGLRVSNIGNTQDRHAGIEVSSFSNGTGTGLRFGAQGPTLGTAIEITGGTGMRYNALNDGQGTAITIGGTARPNKGILVDVGGSENVGLYSTSNTLGTAVVGDVRSSSFSDEVLQPGTGVVGSSRTRSNSSADTIVGVLGTVQREGQGSLGMRSVGVRARAKQTSATGRGIAIGLLAEASVNDPQVGTSIAVKADGTVDMLIMEYFKKGPFYSN